MWSWPRVGKRKWGPPGWNWAHKLAINYPENPSFEDVERATRKLWTFLIGLPCVECRDHSVDYYKRNPPDLSSSQGFQRWMWAFHNAVNARLGKRQLTYEQYRRAYHDEIFLAEACEGWTPPS